MSTPTADALTEDMVIQTFVDSVFDLLNYEEAVGMPDFDDPRNFMTPERMLAAVLERTNIPVTIAKDFINQHFSPRCGPPALGPPTAVSLTENMILQTNINHESDKLMDKTIWILPFWTFSPFFGFIFRQFLIVFDDLDNIYNKTIPKTLALDNHFISGYFNKLPKICILMITYFEILYFHCLANGYFKCDPD